MGGGIQYFLAWYFILKNWLFQAMENMFRSVSARLENYMLHYQESYQIEGDQHMCIDVCVCVCTS